jgi:hypothetical protein
VIFVWKKSWYWKKVTDHTFFSSCPCRQSEAVTPHFASVASVATPGLNSHFAFVGIPSLKSHFASVAPVASVATSSLNSHFALSHLA